MRTKTRLVALAGLAFGICTGLLWMAIGDRYLDATFGQRDFNWRVLPFILPLIISILLFSADRNSSTRRRLLNSVLFFGFDYVGYWIPFAVFVLLVILCGGM